MPWLFRAYQCGRYRHLQGARRSLSYLQWLGIDAVWIALFYPSPLVRSVVRYAVENDAHPGITGASERADRKVATCLTAGDAHIIGDVIPEILPSVVPGVRCFARERETVAGTCGPIPGLDPVRSTGSF